MFLHSVHTITDIGKDLCIQATNYVSDAQLLKKTGQIFASVLTCVVLLDPSKQKSLSRLTTVILSVNLIDGFRFLKLPYTLLFFVSAESVNEFAVANVLKDAFLRKIYPGVAMDKIPADEIAPVVNFAKLIVKNQLEGMSNHEEDACRNIEQFQERLLTRLSKYAGPKPDLKLDLTTLTMQDLKDSARTLGLESSLLRPTRLLDKILAAIWVTVDIGSVFCYLKDWGLLAMEMGRLELFMLGTVFFGCAFDVIESIRKLHDEHLFLSPQEKRKAVRNAISSFFEAILFGGLYISTKTAGAAINPLYIQGIAIISRVIGAVVIFTTPKHVFFQLPRPVNVSTAAVVPVV